MITVNRDTVAIRKQLTRLLPNFQNPKHKTRVEFFQALPGGSLRVPRFYAADTLGLPIDDDAFTPEPLPTGLALNGELQETAARPQQTVCRRAVARLRARLGASVVMPCGSGKTNAAIGIALALGVRTAVLCHKNFLLDQWQERLQAFVAGDFRIGRVQQDRCEVSDFTLCSIPSLLSRDYEGLEFGLVIVDEAHHIAAATYSKVLSVLRTRYTLGLTATPKRRDGLEDMIYLLLGAPCFTVVVPERPDVQVNVVRCDVGLREPTRRDGRVNLARMISDMCVLPSRNALLVRVALALHAERPGSQGLLLSDRVAHLQTLHALLVAAGVPTGIVCGSVNTELDGQVRFSSFLTLSTFAMFSEAVDFHGDFLILATPKSAVEQATGRVLRGHSARRPVIVDVLDPVGTLIGMARKRRAHYVARGYEVIDLDAARLT